jgi:hypothetical protein
MTRERAVLPWRVVAERELVFHQLGWAKGDEKGLLFSGSTIPRLSSRPERFESVKKSALKAL